MSIVRFVMLEEAKAGDALVVDHLGSGGLLRRWRSDCDPHPMYTTEADVVAGQVVVVADGTTSRVRPEGQR